MGERNILVGGTNQYVQDVKRATNKLASERKETLCLSNSQIEKLKNSSNVFKWHNNLRAGLNNNDKKKKMILVSRLRCLKSPRASEKDDRVVAGCFYKNVAEEF